MPPCTTADYLVTFKYGTLTTQSNMSKVEKSLKILGNRLCEIEQVASAVVAKVCPRSTKVEFRSFFDLSIEEGR
jgi:hypothetical protein